MTIKEMHSSFFDKKHWECIGFPWNNYKSNMNFLKVVNPTKYEKILEDKRERNKRYEQKHPEKVKENKRKYYHTHKNELTKVEKEMLEYFK